MKSLLPTIALALACLARNSAGAQSTMTFEGIAVNTPFPFNATYEENGIVALSKSNNSFFGDPLHAENGNRFLYFHGANEYVEFRPASGASFNLSSLKLVTNGYLPRWIETSRSNGTVPLGAPTTVTTISFTDPQFENVSWVRVGTPGNATQIDDITLTPLPPSAPAITAQPPATITALADSTVTLTVVVSGSPAPTFQWAKDGVPVAGATASVLKLANITSAAAGGYTVTATNASGTATSSPSVLVVTPRTNVEPPPGIVAWWSFDESGGNIAADRVGNHVGAYANSPAPIAGRVRNAISFNGTNYVSVPDSDAWAFGSRNFTIELWAKFTTPGGGSVGHPSHIFVGNDEGGGSRNKWFFALGGGFLNFHINSPTLGAKFFPLVPFSPNVDQWYHLAVVRNGALFTIFVDGEPMGSAVNGDAVPNASAPLTIGQAEEIGFMNGAVDELTIYSRALDDGEIRSIYDAGSTGKAVGITISPSVGGDHGNVSVRITGSGFAQGASVMLERTGEAPIPSGPVTVELDGTSLRATFDLHDKARGLWDVIVRNPDGTSFSLPAGFTIEASSAAKIWTDIVGLNVIVPGRPQTFHVFYGNTGNVDAVAVPLWIGGIPSNAEVKLGFAVYSPQEQPDIPVDYSSVPTSFTYGNEKIIPLLISSIPAGYVGALQITLKTATSEATRLRSWANKPIFGSPPTDDVITCYSEIIKEVISDTVKKECVAESLSEFWDFIVSQGTGKAFHWPWTIIKIGSKCATESACTLCVVTKLTPSCVVCVAGKVVNTGIDMYEKFKDASELGSACAGVGIAIGEAALDLIAVSSFDPNDKIGPQGAGEQHYVAQDQPLRYVIAFENLVSATAAAQEVFASDQLDPALVDLNSLTLGPISFGDKSTTPPAGETNFTADVDLRPTKNLIVRVTANLNPNTGLLNWHLTSIDPATGDLPVNPLIGFLPPDINPPDGDGSVTFSVKPRQGLPTGTVITNSASIVFDLNPAIGTPTWFNTIDGTKPQSHVLPLAAVQATPTFPVTWAGSDVGAGIKDYSVFVSDNGGAFAPVLENTTATAMSFTGATGHTYAFYSVARDLVGNVEETPTVADTTTTVTVGDTTPPVLTLPSDLVVEADSPAGTIVRFSATATDNIDGVVPVSFSQNSGTLFSIGSTTVVATATDAAGNKATRSFTIRVQDTTPPAITGITASPNTLWPVDHKLVPIVIDVRVSDFGDAAPLTRITAVASNEPINGPGDGNTAPDWQITGPLSVNLRAERAGNVRDRIYTVTLQSTDKYENSSTRTVMVTVPHNR